MFEHRPAAHPYPGLRPFESSESEIFFGREGHTDRLLEILQRERFLAVVGPSGGGKSSLVRAGLLPALAGDRLDTGSHWRLALLRPGSQPLLALAQALLHPEVLGPYLLTRGRGDASTGASGEVVDIEEAAALLAAELRQPGGGLDRLLRQAQARRQVELGEQYIPTLNLLVLVDQFEELFTYREAAADANEPARFVGVLLQACRLDGGPRPEPGPGDIRVVVALTMRTDFLGHCVAFDELPEAINRAQYLMPRLKPDELHRAIVGPARLFGGEVEEGFAEGVIDEVAADSDQLPLLQHALAQWWRDAEQVDPAHLLIDGAVGVRAGTLREALDRHAEAEYGRMPLSTQRACEALFRAITAGREGADAVRRPLRLREIAEWSGEPYEELVRVVMQLADPEVSFLYADMMPRDDSVIDLTHEALIRHWHRLKGWVASELHRGQEWRRWQARAMEYAAGKAGLLVGADLARALEWWNPDWTDTDGWHAWHPTVAWARRYSDASVWRDGGDAAFEQLRQYLVSSRDRERRAKRVRAAWLAVMVVLLAVTLAVFAAQQFSKVQAVRDARTENLFDSQLTHANLLARVDDYAAARELLVQTAELDESLKPERRHARNLLAGHVATMSAPADRVYTGGDKPLPALSGGVAVSPDGRWLAAAGEQGTLALFDAGSGKLVRFLSGGDASAAHKPDKGRTGRVIAIFAADGSLYSGGEDGRVIRWAVPSGKQLGDWSNEGRIRSLALRPDGRQLAVGHGGQVTLYALPEGRLERSLEGHKDWVSDRPGGLAYSPDGQSLASASLDRTVRLWRVATGRALWVLERPTGPVYSVAFSPDGQELATAGADGRILLWRTDRGWQTGALTGHQNAVFGLAFSADGQTLYSASRDLTLRSWDVPSRAPRRVWQGHEAELSAVALAPPSSPGRQQRWVYTAAGDGSLRRWSLAADGTGGQGGAQAIGSWIWSIPDEDELTSAAISPDGRLAVVGSRNGGLKLHALPTGEALGEVKDAHGGQVLRIAFSPDGRQVATGSHDRNAKLWTVAPQPGGAKMLTLRHSFQHGESVYGVAFSPDGTRLATAARDGQVGLFDLGSLQGRLIPAHGDEAASVSFDGEGEWLLTTGSDRRVLQWRVDTWHEEKPEWRELATLQDAPTWADMAPNGRRAAVVGRNQAVQVLDVAGDGRKSQRLVGHENTVLRAIHTPDSRLLATVSADLTLRVWDLYKDADRQRQLFTQRLPAEDGLFTALWDFDFRCPKETGDCLAMVPLAMGRVAVYRWPYEKLPDGWQAGGATPRSKP